MVCHIPQSLRQVTKSTVLVPWIFLHPRQTKTEKNRLSEIPWHGLVLNKMLNIDCLCSTWQVCQMTKKDQKRKKYGLLPPKIAEYDIISLGHGLCGIFWDRSIYNNDTSQNTLSACNHNDRSRNQAQGSLNLSKVQ
jgi:hypothetical protein